MAERGQVNFVITAKDAASKPIAHINKSLGGLSKTSIATGAAIGTFVGNIGIKAFDALTGAIGGAFDELLQQEALLKRTNNVIKTTGGVAGVSAKHVAALSESIESVTGVQAESIQNGENLLLTFTRIRNEAGKGNDVFDQTTRLMVDMSTALGTDAKSAAMQLGKALNDPVKGVAALRRAGVSFTADQLKTIKRLQESGDLLGAQKVILKEVKREFGGAGKAAGQSFAGQMAILNDAVGDLLKGAMRPLLPIILKLAKLATSYLVPALEQLVAKVDTFAKGSGPGLDRFLAGLQRAFAAIAPVVVTVARFLGSVFGQAVKVVLRIVPQLTGLFRGIQPIIARLAAFFSGVLLPAFNRIGSAVAETVIPLFQKLAAFVITRVLPAVNELVAFLSTALAPAIDEITGFIVDKLLPTFARVAGFIIDNVLPAIADLIGWLWGGGSGPLAVALGAVIGLIKPVVEAMNLVYDSINRAITAIGDFAKAVANSPIGGLLGTLGGLFAQAPTLTLQTVGAPAAGTSGRSTATLHNTTTVNVDLDGRTLGTAMSRYVGQTALSDGGSRLGGGR